MKKVILFLLLSLCITPAQAKPEKYRVKLPLGVNTSCKKLAYSYRGMEKLRLLHNKKGKDFNTGIITKKEWDIWKKEIFTEKQSAFVTIILEQKKLLRESTMYTIDLEADLEKVIIP